MPRYDYRCGVGHVTEAVNPVSVDLIYCACGRAALRAPFSPGHLPGKSGFVATPTKERYINLNRAVEAQHELIHQAEKHHVELPDLYKVAKAQVARGDVKAIT